MRASPNSTKFGITPWNARATESHRSSRFDRGTGLYRTGLPLFRLSHRALHNQPYPMGLLRRCPSRGRAFAYNLLTTLRRTSDLTVRSQNILSSSARCGTLDGPYVRTVFV